ncbi:MAG: rhomboid family intramembrane serine protease [Elusimicrobiota bacterium]|nr:rhomboid family intramembrane serine protease [Elusimicrobiota bacterium]MDH5662056.1 rhomboid family intramembrane serine protease [Elusimicrobiota bacterium]
MIPLKDTIPSERYPIATVFLIVVNISVFFYEISLGGELPELVKFAGVVPARFFESQLHTYQGFFGRYFPIFTSLFLHGGWFHLLGNMLYLWIFGDNIEDRLGHFKFLVFYLLCGLGASLAHIFANPTSSVPSIGASGAIAGILGAYFILHPKSRVITLVPIFFFFQIIELPAFVFLGIWFFMQFFNGVLTLGPGTAQAGGIAWWAHIGGFLSGIFFILLLKGKKYRGRR